MINNEYFDIYHGSRDNAPDGLIDKSNVATDIENILDLLFEMIPYKQRGPAFTAARIVEYVANNRDRSADQQDSIVALVTMLMMTLRNVVSNEPSRSVKTHLQNVFSSESLQKLNAELSALPYRSVATDNEGSFTECEDYSVVRVLCDRFALEYVIEESEVDDEILNYEIIDEVDIEPEADEDDGDT
jgi:hypothetical protein